MSPNEIKPWIDLIVTYGGTLVLFSAFIYFAIRWAAVKFNMFAQIAKRAEVENVRKINSEIDREENEKSLAKMRAVQLYLSNNMEEIFEKGIDSVNVWLNHNGTRIGKFHFIFYSLIAEVVNDGAKGFGNSKIQPSKLPYYIFADYEEEIMKKGFVFKHFEDLKSTPKAIAKDFGTKSVFGLPIKSISGQKIDGIIFFSAVRDKFEDVPNVQRIADDVRAILV